MAQILIEGDKVAFLNENLKGVVVRRIADDRVMVETEDGFEIPMMISELVLIERDKNEALPNSATPQSSAKNEVRITDCAELLIGVKPNKMMEDVVNRAIANHSPNPILFTVNICVNAKWNTLSQGSIMPNEWVKIDEFLVSKLDEFKQLNISYLKIQKAEDELQIPTQSNVVLKPVKLLASTEILSELGMPGIRIAIRNPSKTETSPVIGKVEVEKDEKVTDVIDLHAEALDIETRGLSNHTILTKQLHHAELCIFKAVKEKKQKLVLIHGIGTGKLKASLYELLAEQPDVHQYDEADVSKYGYGAVALYFKYH
ncbi:MAG: Smr/MutS family protein [Bacteroidota bacterium]|nr:Smr/MutS family protein [Bacteroidota bacterium]